MALKIELGSNPDQTRQELVVLFTLAWQQVYPLFDTKVTALSQDEQPDTAAQHHFFIDILHEELARPYIELRVNDLFNSVQSEKVIIPHDNILDEHQAKVLLILLITRLQNRSKKTKE